MQRRTLLSILFSICLYSALIAQTLVIKPDDGNLTYMGRVGKKSGSTDFYWSGSSVSINFSGNELKAILDDQRGSNYFHVIIDRDSIYKLKLDSGKHTYELAKRLEPGKHSVTLFKTTEYDRGKTSFLGFEVNDGTQILPASKAQNRRIEFYGNSITCGYAAEDTIGDSPESQYENHYLSYAAITARHFNADYHCIAKSGIGIMVSWFPYTMFDIYDRLNPEDPKSLWNFKHFAPDLVIINLFQNDSWLVNMPEHIEFKRVFGTKKPSEEYVISSYQKFLVAVRSRYPDSKIICALGSMDATREGSLWPTYIKKALNNLNDKEIYTHFFPYKNTPGHPGLGEQKEMADNLIDFIETQFGW